MALFLRLLDSQDKETALADAVARLRDGAGDAFEVAPETFSQVPSSPFAYWASTHLLESFRRFKSVGDYYTIRSGSMTYDDFRFLRFFGEIPVVSISNNNTAIWQYIVKGGSYSQYYSDVHLLMNWVNDGDYVAQVIYNHRPREGFRWGPKSPVINYLFKPSITWSRRSQKGFSARILPENCVFSDKSPVVQSEDLTSLWRFLAIANSALFQSFLQLQMAFGSYEVGVIQRTPIPDLDNADGARLGELALACVEIKRNLDRANETNHVFHLPALLQVQGATLAARAAAWARRPARCCGAIGEQPG